MIGRFRSKPRAFPRQRSCPAPPRIRRSRVPTRCTSRPVRTRRRAGCSASSRWRPRRRTSGGRRESSRCRAQSRRAPAGLTSRPHARSRSRLDVGLTPARGLWGRDVRAGADGLQPAPGRVRARYPDPCTHLIGYGSGFQLPGSRLGFTVRPLVPVWRWYRRIRADFGIPAWNSEHSEPNLEPDTWHPEPDPTQVSSGPNGTEPTRAGAATVRRR